MGSLEDFKYYKHLVLSAAIHVKVRDISWVNTSGGNYDTGLARGLILAADYTYDHLHELFVFDSSGIAKVTSRGGHIGISDFSIVNSRLRIKSRNIDGIFIALTSI